MLNYPTYWLTPAKWSLDTSFDQWSGFIFASWGIKKIKEEDWFVYVWWIHWWYNKVTSINASKVSFMVNLLDNWNIDWTKFTWQNVVANIINITPTIDGKYILATYSLTYHIYPVTRSLCRLNADFSFDEIFTPWVYTWTPSYVKALSTGKILVLTNSSTIIWLNADWSIDWTFTWPTFNGVCRQVLERSDWKYVILWDFTTVNWVTYRNIVLLNTDWTVDSSFNTGNGYNNSTGVFGEIQSDDKIVLYWTLTTYNSVTVNRIVRVNTDWTLDWTFVMWTGFNNTTIARIQADWKIIVSWNFTTYKWVAYNRVLRLDSVWTVDGTYAVWTWFNNTISSVVLDSNWRCFFGWNLTTYNSVAQTWYCIKLNTDWSKYTNFVTNDWFDAIVFSDKSIKWVWWNIIVVSPNHTKYQWINTYNAQSIEVVTKLSQLWSLETSFPKRKWFWWFAILWTKMFSFDILSWKIIVTWDFSTFDGYTANKIALINADWTFDTAFVSWAWLNSAIAWIIFTNDWNIVIVGSFTSYNWTARNRIVKIKQDWTIDWTFAYTSWFAWYISWWIYQQSDWKLITYNGFFARTYNWINSNRLHRLNADWTIDSTFMTNIWTWPNSTPSIVYELSDWTIIVWWQFTQWNWVSWYNRIIALNNDWTINTSYNFWTGFDNTVLAIWEDNSWNIIIGWDFLNYNWSTVNRLIRLSNTWASLQTYWTWLNATCRTISIVWNKMYIWWDFTDYDGNPVWYVARIFI